MKIITTFISALVFIVFAIAAHAEEQGWQSHQSIAEALKAYIAQNAHLPGDYELTISPLDNRLNLPLCSEALEIFTTTEIIKPGRTALGVRCNAEKKWSIFTSVFIKNYQMIVVLTQPVRQGEIITRQQLALEKRETTNLRDDFVTQIEQVEKKQALRQLSAGTIISLKNLTEPKLIKIGDVVAISTAKSGISIRMSGVAMMDGIKGQVVRVKNQSSGRIIEATVVESGLVLVNY